MDPLTIGFALAKFAPDLIKWFTGSDKAADVATKAIDLAKTVTGQPDGDSALKALEADPALAEKYQEAVLANNLEFAKLAVQNAADINTTMQAETKAEHWASWFWRPFIGMAVGLNVITSSVLVVGVFIGVIFGSVQAAAAVAQLPMVLGALAGINGTVLPILGIASWFRGKAQADVNNPMPVRG